MSTTKNQHFFFKFRKTMRRAKYNKKLIIDHTEVTDHMAGKIRSSGARKSVFLKPSSVERYAPPNFLLLVTLQGTLVRLTCSIHLVARCAPNEIDYGNYGQMKLCNNISQFPHVRAGMLSEKRKP